MRNTLVHEYFRIDRDAVWSVVEHDLPALEPAVRKIVADLERG